VVVCFGLWGLFFVFVWFWFGFFLFFIGLAEGRWFFLSVGLFDVFWVSYFCFGFFLAV